MQSSRSGNPVPNQFIISTDKGTYFKSYDSVIALETWGGQVIITDDWNYSKTTSKYTCEFLNMSLQEIKKAIKSGQFTLDNNLTIE